jgi:hypothetical protein
MPRTRTIAPIARRITVATASCVRGRDYALLCIA